MIVGLKGEEDSQPLGKQEWRKEMEMDVRANSGASRILVGRVIIIAVAMVVVGVANVDGTRRGGGFGRLGNLAQLIRFDHHHPIEAMTTSPCTSGAYKR